MAETLFDDEELNRLAATLSVPILEDPESYQAKPIIEDDEDPESPNTDGKAEAS